MTRPIHVILITHTPDRLRRTILGVAASKQVPDSITLSCDSDDPAIRNAVQQAASEAGIRITLIQRPNAGTGRASQTRNNAVREIIARGTPGNAGLVFFDGDCVPMHDTIGAHARALENTDLVLGWRYDLTPEQDADFDEQALKRGSLPFTPQQTQQAAIERRHRRYARQLIWRRLGLSKPHKPKLLSANFACSIRAYQKVNGFDETFEGWGQEDDDFGRRILADGNRVHIGIRDILVCHQHHITRAPGNWNESPNAHRLKLNPPTACQHGLKNPADQPTPAVVDIGP